MLTRKLMKNSPTINGSLSPKPVRRFHQRALIWDLEETRALLDLLKDERILKAIESVRTREIYHEIAERLKQVGFNRDWNQIRGRVKNLKFSYKQARALHEEQGQSTLACRFYDDLHYLFGHKYKRQRTKKRSLQQQQQMQTNLNIENDNEEIVSNINNNEPDDITDDDDKARQLCFYFFSLRNHVFCYSQSTKTMNNKIFLMMLHRIIFNDQKIHIQYFKQLELIQL